MVIKVLKQDNKYLVEHRKEGFDKSKFEVVGSPSITEDGIASGFSSSNYLTQNITITNPSDWKITFDNITRGNHETIQCHICFATSGGNNFTLRNDANGVIRATLNINGINTYNKIFTASNTIGGKIGYKDGKYFVTINGVTEEISTSTLITSSQQTLRIGISNDINMPNLGSIDLKQLSITVDGKEIFNGQIDKYYALGG